MKYNKILIKLSGEALQGSRQSGIDPEVAQFVASEIKEAQDLGAKVAVVVGGGNIYRGAESFEKDGIREETSHWMGMLAICINCLALSDLFKSFGVENHALSALGQVGDMGSYSVSEGKKTLDQGKVLLLSGGEGKPFRSSDSGAATRAKELDMEVIFKMTKVDGVYDSDPFVNPNAKKFSAISFDEVLERDLKVMDRGAFETCKENGISIVVFRLEKGNIRKAVMGQEIGTVVK
ncbi:MAG: uridine monophosphate kinase [Patescibacteria group bacterium]